MTTYMPRELADEWGVSERTLRRMARELGACRILGKAMFLTEEDRDAVLAALKPPPLPPFSTGKVFADVHPANGSYEDLMKRLRKLPPKGNLRRRARSTPDGAAG